MSRVIRIESCEDCTNRDHKGAFAEVYCVPVCHAVHPSRELPPHSGTWVRHQASGRTHVCHPDWCPLEKLPTN